MLARLLACGCATLVLGGPAHAQVVTQPTPGAPTAPRTPPRDPQARKETGTAVIRGRVIGGDTGQPLRRAHVSLRSEAIEDGRSTMTDEFGRYEFKELPGGRVHVTAAKGGYVSMEHGQRRPAQRGRPIEIADGQVLANVDFNLPRGGVITGRVTDEFGEPVTGVSIKIENYRFMNGRRQLMPVWGSPWASTDDLGRFRAYGLPAGEYYVSAAYQAYSAGASDAQSGYATTYYPGTTSVSDAQRIRVTAGAETSSANFAMRSARTVKISGTVLASTGGPPSSGYLMMQVGGSASLSFQVGYAGQVKPDGSFLLSSVSPGEYVLHVNTGDGDTQESAVMPLTVGNDDITGLTLTTAPPAVIRGHVTFESGQPPTGLRPAQFNMFASAAEPMSMMMAGAGITPREDWTFEAKLREGPALVRNGRLPEGWFVRSVLQGGVDVTDTGVTFRPGEQVDDVQIVLSNRATRVTGAVTDGTGRPARDYTVVIFADDPDRWGRMTRHVETARPDQQGQFSIARLPPGHYLAVAVREMEEGRHTDPEFLQDLRGYGTQLQLAEGDQKTLTLPLTDVQ